MKKYYFGRTLRLSPTPGQGYISRYMIQRQITSNVIQLTSNKSSNKVEGQSAGQLFFDNHD